MISLFKTRTCLKCSLNITEQRAAITAGNSLFCFSLSTSLSLLFSLPFPDSLSPSLAQSLPEPVLICPSIVRLRHPHLGKILV